MVGGGAVSAGGGAIDQGGGRGRMLYDQGPAPPPLLCGGG